MRKTAVVFTTAVLMGFSFAQQSPFGFGFGASALPSGFGFFADSRVALGSGFTLSMLADVGFGASNPRSTGIEYGASFRLLYGLGPLYFGPYAGIDLRGFQYGGAVGLNLGGFVAEAQANLNQRSNSSQGATGLVFRFGYTFLTNTFINPFTVVGLGTSSSTNSSNNSSGSRSSSGSSGSSGTLGTGDIKPPGSSNSSSGSTTTSPIDDSSRSSGAPNNSSGGGQSGTIPDINRNKTQIISFDTDGIRAYIMTGTDSFPLTKYITIGPKMYTGPYKSVEVTYILDLTLVSENSGAAEYKLKLRAYKTDYPQCELNIDGLFVYGDDTNSSIPLSGMFGITLKEESTFEGERRIIFSKSGASRGVYFLPRVYVYSCSLD